MRFTDFLKFLMWDFIANTCRGRGTTYLRRKGELREVGKLTALIDGLITYLWNYFVKYDREIH